jgi:hypothetical protein
MSGAGRPWARFLLCWGLLQALGCSGDSNRAGQTAAGGDSGIAPEGSGPVATGGAGVVPGGNGGSGAEAGSGTGGVGGGSADASAPDSGLDGGPVLDASGDDATTDAPDVDATVALDATSGDPAARLCRAGAFAGSFTGWYVLPIAPLFPVPLSGSIAFELIAADGGDVLVVSAGTVVASSDTPIGPIPFDASVTASVDCATGAFEGILAGQYTIDTTTYAFSGPIEARYDVELEGFIDGTWMVGEPTWSTPPPPYGGSGAWAAPRVDTDAGDPSTL